MVVSGNVIEALFQQLDTVGSANQILPYVGKSFSDGITTLTIENQADVTNGCFMITTTGM
jgi:hypothetical protein